MPTPPPLSAPIAEPNLLIAICKATHSIRNPAPHYATLSYHRLFEPFYTCLSSIYS